MWIPTPNTPSLPVECWGGTEDEFLYQHTTLAGDGVMSAYIKSIQNGVLNQTPNAKGGIMVRSATTKDSPYVAVWVQADNQVAFQWRDATGVNASTPKLVGGTKDNKFIRLERSGKEFTASYSTDGTNYTVVGTQTVSILESTPWGLFGLSGFKFDKQSEVKYTNVTYTAKSPNREATVNLIQDDSFVASAVVFSDGSWLIPDVPAGTYDIQQIPPGGYFQTAPFYYAISFSNEDLNSPNSKPFNSLTVADFDGDSHLDLAFTSPNDNMFTVVFGAGDGSFTDPHFYDAGTQISDPVKISSTGQPGSDVWILDGKTGYVSWLKNPTGNRDRLFSTATGGDFVPTGATAIDISADNVVQFEVPKGTNIGHPPHAGSGSVSPNAYTIKGSGSQNTLDKDFGSNLFYQYIEATGDGTITARIVDQSYQLSTGGTTWVSAGIMIRSSTHSNSDFVSTTIELRGDQGSLNAASNYRVDGKIADRQSGEIYFPDNGDNPSQVRLVKTGNTIQFSYNSGINGWMDLGQVTADFGDSFLIGFFASSSRNQASGGDGQLNTATIADVTSTFTTSSQSVVSYQDNSGGSDTGFKVLNATVADGVKVAYTSPTLIYSGEMELVDLNKDGFLDVLLNGGNNVNEVTVALGNGLGDFTLFDVPMPPTFTNAGPISALDVNGDKRVDIVAADSATSEVVVMIQDGRWWLSTLRYDNVEHGERRPSGFPRTAGPE